MNNIKKGLATILMIFSSILGFSQTVDFNGCGNRPIAKCVNLKNVTCVNCNDEDHTISKKLIYDASGGIKVTDFSRDMGEYAVLKIKSFASPNNARSTAHLKISQPTLENNKYYKVSFYQANGTFHDNSYQSAYGYWNVQVGNTNQNIGLSAVRKHTLWRKVEIILQYKEGPKEIKIAPIAIGDSNVNQFFLIDGVNITEVDSPNQTDGNGSNAGYGSFNPTPGKKYVLSAWVKQENTNAVKSYDGARIHIRTGEESIYASPVGLIIDGWQKIEKEFTIPSGASGLQLELQNLDSSKKAYFDDVRIHPFDGSMKSFVYDSETQRLMAELDENNYTTFYEYDQEGGLIRVKKETERGVKTIQETRSNSHKKY